MKALVSEKLDLKLDMRSLTQFFTEQILSHRPVFRNPAVGGWSLQSSDGSYQDGWQMNYLPYNGPGNQGPEWKPESEEQKLWKTMQDYGYPTDLCKGPFLDLLNSLTAQGWNPRRARIIRLSANSLGQWHQDGSSRFYQVRLHVPLLTNSKCFFEIEEGSEHLAADGSAYLVHVNRKHRVINEGDSHRYHLVMNVWDTRGLSTDHRYDSRANSIELTVPNTL